VATYFRNTPTLQHLCVELPVITTLWGVFKKIFPFYTFLYIFSFVWSSARFFSQSGFSSQPDTSSQYYLSFYELFLCIWMFISCVCDSLWNFDFSQFSRREVY
jgi:hypothetical protein